MPPYSLTIARFPGQNQEHPDSTSYVMKLMKTLLDDDRLSGIDLWHLSDTPITMSRNRCVLEAMQRRSDYLLMIDSDMCPDYDSSAPTFWETAWNFMMDRREQEDQYRAGLLAGGRSDRAVVAASRDNFPYATIAAPYGGPPPTEHVYVFRWANRETGSPDPDFRLEMFDRDHAATLTGIQEVAALPTGLILYDTRLFSVLPPPWYDYEWADEPYRTKKASTEDVFQTRNASLMGQPQFITWDCWAAHIKTKRVTKPLPLTIDKMRSDFAQAIVRGAGASFAPGTQPAAKSAS